MIGQEEGKVNYSVIRTNDHIDYTLYGYDNLLVSENDVVETTTCSKNYKVVYDDDKEISLQQSDKTRVYVQFDYQDSNRREIVYSENGTVDFPQSPKKEGYEFVKWNTQPDGNGDDIGEQTRITESITVYAIWKTVAFQISYDLYGGIASNPTSYTTESSAITLNNPFKENYIFKGWTGSNGTIMEMVVIIPAGSSGDKTFVAHYVPECTVVFSANGGSGCMNPIKMEAGELLLPVSSFEAPDNMEFDKWQIGNKTYSEKEKVNISGNTEILATWKKKNVNPAPTPAPITLHTVDITVDSSMGLATGAGLYYDGASVTVTAVPSEGYVFIGWMENGVLVSADVSYTFTVSKDITLMAEFEEDTTQPVVIRVTGLTVSPNDITLKKNESKSLTVSIYPETATNKEVIWNTNNSSVARVKNGLITAIAGGEAEIIASTTDGNISARCKVTVIEESGTTTSDPNPSYIAVSQKVDTTTYFGRTYKRYRIDPAKNAVISRNGIIIAKKPGITTVYGLEKAGKKWVASAQFTITIEKPQVKKKTVYSTQIGEMIDGQENLSSVEAIIPEFWESSNEKVATIDSKTGRITTVGKGSAKITAYYGSGKNAAKYSFNVCVKPPVISKTKATMKTGQSLKLVMRNTKKTVKWQSSDDTIAFVDQTGKVIAFNCGAVKISGIVEGVPYECSITVKAPTIKKFQDFRQSR